MVEVSQLFLDCTIQFIQGEKLTVPQRSKDPSGDNADGVLHERFVLRCPWTGGDNCGAVMLCHFLVGFVQDGLRAGILDDSTEIVVGMNMSCDPCFLLHVEERFRIGVAAVRKHCYKEIGGQALAGARVR